MTQMPSPKKVGFFLSIALDLLHCSVLSAWQFHADEENTSGNISPAPAFQTQAVSLSAHAAVTVVLVCFPKSQ